MEMIQQLHLAAQYLATTGISFLEKKEDDSHTNLGFSVDKNRLETWPLDKSDLKLCLNYDRFALEWSTHPEINLSLDGKRHQEVVEWINDTAKNTGLAKPYSYKLHYHLPYTIGDSFRFALISSNQVKKLGQLRSLAQRAITSFLEMENLSSDIRIWPHHFDTGADSSLNDGSGKSVGLGMAIPDSMIDNLYFYISGYRGSKNLNTWAFKDLSYGKWMNDTFKGAVLPASVGTQDKVVQFFKEALQSYRT